MTIERKSSATCLAVGNKGDGSQKLARVKLFRLVLSLGMLVTEVVAAQEKPLRRFELRAVSPAFLKLVARTEKLGPVATGFGFTEGPVWDPRGFLDVSDETRNQFLRVYPDGHREILIQLGDPDGNTFDRDFNPIAIKQSLIGVIFSPSRSVVSACVSHSKNRAGCSPQWRESNNAPRKRDLHVSFEKHHGFFRSYGWRGSGMGPGTEGDAPDAAHPRSPHAWLCHGQ